MDYNYYPPYTGYPSPSVRPMWPGAYQPQQMPTQPTQGMPEVVPVPTIQQVEQVGLQPGHRKIVMVQNAPVIAMRVADQVSGLIDTKYYNLVEFTPGTQPQADGNDYVTRKEFDEFVKSLKPENGKKEAAE